MSFRKKMLDLVMAVIMLMTCIQLPGAYAANDGNTVTVNVTNTPVRGDVLLEKTGLQLVRFEDEQDAYGNTVMRPVYQNGYLAGAVFELRAAEDIVGKEGSVFYQEDELIETLTTSKTGAVKSKVLPLGKYTLTEISAPDGYVLDSVPHPFTLAAVDRQTAIVEVKVLGQGRCNGRALGKLGHRHAFLPELRLEEGCQLLRGHIVQLAGGVDGGAVCLLYQTAELRHFLLQLQQLLLLFVQQRVQLLPVGGIPLLFLVVQINHLISRWAVVHSHTASWPIFRFSDQQSPPGHRHGSSCCFPHRCPHG